MDQDGGFFFTVLNIHFLVERKKRSVFKEFLGKSYLIERH